MKMKSKIENVRVYYVFLVLFVCERLDKECILDIDKIVGIETNETINEALINDLELKKTIEDLFGPEPAQPMPALPLLPAENTLHINDSSTSAEYEKMFSSEVENDCIQDIDNIVGIETNEMINEALINDLELKKTIEDLFGPEPAQPMPANPLLPAKNTPHIINDTSTLAEHDHFFSSEDDNGYERFLPPGQIKKSYKDYPYSSTTDQSIQIPSNSYPQSQHSTHETPSPPAMELPLNSSSVVIVTRTSPSAVITTPAPIVVLSSPAVDISSPTVDISSPTVDISSPIVNISSPTVNISSPTVNLSSPTIDLSSPRTPIVATTNSTGLGSGGKVNWIRNDEEKGLSFLVWFIIGGIMATTSAGIFYFLRAYKNRSPLCEVTNQNEVKLCIVTHLKLSAAAVQQFRNRGI